ncbi:MAG TPA: UDP-N-acetylglucosamine 2-epimerase (non-hydrolyzing) [Jiangellaceae bacterium]
MKRVMLVFGTRPEAIKLAPVARELTARADHDPVIVTTAQHREMLDQVLELFEISPDIDLNLGRPRQDLASLTARTLESLSPVIEKEDPDAILVQGDTMTTVVGALAGFLAGVPVVHLEAGLRTSDRRNPFPEEMNRRLTTQLSELHLAATATARENLLNEGVPPDRIEVTGNTVIDSLLWAVEQQRPVTDPLLAAAEAHEGPVVLWTTHRRESWGEPMARVARAVTNLAWSHPDLLVVLPLHRNPAVREVLLPEIDGHPNVLVGEPTDYWSFSRLLRRADILLTDSGGIQEEAPSLGKPVLVTRDSTERVEAIEAGVALLVGTDPLRIMHALDKLLTNPKAGAEISRRMNPYGDGKAAERTVAALDRLLGDPVQVPEFAAGARQDIGAELDVAGST